MKKKKGKFIVLCGGEGSGKSTILSEIKKSLSKSVFTREPGGSLYAEDIRELIKTNPYAKDAFPETMFYLFWASRVEHLAKTIIPAVQSGKIVISDRFDSCTYAYQIYAGGIVKLDKLFWTIRSHSLDKYEPDLYIFLDLDPAIGLLRTKGRKDRNDHFDDRELGYHKAVRKGYMKFFSKINKNKYCIIDASQSINFVKKDVLSAISELIKS
ncbi:MAG TPA: dTMP kinase [Candidatus Paceibacterota bacterium]